MIYLLASDHSEMASYIDGCLSCFFALFARALFKLEIEIIFIIMN